ncbi:HesB/IscA family protein [Oceanibacterium hippocampi]|uniref:Iron-binding protein IscA n=1 Tax=Oceanibacterium hippocampi TaxID=745714 RepID=A0A1Y5T7Z6_9PROT|nr:iron-sulfur cluster assembly accessory protein [Oceanibacterium hippocampi]SLN57643.1 Iron-binding protein IscA [Oceanibacterium hippocampi]
MTENLMSLTDRAADRVRHLIATSDKPVKGLRIGVTTTGCSGLSYTMDFAEDIGPDDKVVVDKDITLVIDPAALQYVAGSEMDWVEERLASRFTFENPNEKGKCGCGTSFHV